MQCRRPARRTGWRQLIGFNLLTGIVLGIAGLVHRPLRSAIHIHRRNLAYYSTEAGAERHRDHARLPARRGRLPRRPGLCQLPAQAAARASAVAGRARVRGARAASLLQPVDRPQGRRQAVHGRDRAVLLRRRAERDADPHRAASAQRPRVRRQPVPDAGRHARVDDDGDHDLGAAGAVCQLAGADDDRLAADGVPADRVVHVLAADGRRGDPAHDDLLRRLPDRLDGLPAARALRAPPATTPTSASSRWSACR